MKKVKSIRLIGAIAALSLLFGIGISSNAINNQIETKASSSDYWSTVNGDANASTLFNKLHALIDTNTTTIGYGGLWEAYKKTDLVPGTSKIWDMYGGFQFTYQSQGKNYSKEGDCYNREHSIPKSWWGSTNDERYSDIVHLVPTDGSVNNKRSNFAFGEVSSASYTYSFPARTDGNGNAIQSAGYSKLGTPKSINGISINSASVFEPDDQYKGDFARIYYYFATRYGPKSKIATSGEGEKMFSTDSSNFYMTNYGKALMNKWHVQDPVSQKELDRNDGIEETQGNRNPYVDHPEWADKIFGSNYEDTNGTITDNTPRLSISASSTEIKAGESLTLTANVSNMSGTVQWYVEDYSTDVITLSSTSGSSITVNGISNGTKKVWAYLGTISSSIEISVSSGGSSSSLGSATITFGNEDEDINVNSASVTGTDSLGNSWDIKTTGTTSFTPNRDYSQIGSSSKPASSVVFSMNLGEEASFTSFSISLGGFNGTKGDVVLKVGENEVGSGSLDGAKDVTIEANDKSRSGNNISASISGIDKGLKAYGISYSCSKKSDSSKTLSSISLDTDNVKKTFDVGEAFSYSGLVVTASYSDSSIKVVSPTSVSAPNMNTAGVKTVTVSYSEGGITKTAYYQITVNSPEAEYIYATANKTFHPGETISYSDIQVKDNLGNTINDFEFSGNGYQFTYEDAPSGGAKAIKAFEDSIAYSTFKCSLEVEVSRVDYANAVSVADELTASDFTATGTTYADFSNVSKPSGAKYAGQSAKNNNGAIQLRSKNSNSGIVSTASGGIISSVSIKVESGSNTIEIYGKNAAYSSATDLYDSSKQGTKVGSLSSNGTVEFNDSYAFLGIRSSSGAIYISSITINYGAKENAKNVSNFIMINDTESQCLTKLDQAIAKLNDMDSKEKNEFYNSLDYVISTARTRLEAWAIHEGKSLSYEDGTYAANKNKISLNVDDESYDYMIILIAAGCPLVVLCFALTLRRKSMK